MRGKATKLTPAEVDDLVAKYNSGSILTEVATFASLSVPTVTKILKSNGVTIRPKGRQPKKNGGVA